MSWRELAWGAALLIALALFAIGLSLAMDCMSGWMGR